MNPQQGIAQKFNEEFKKVLDETFYPMDQVSDTWKKYAMRALEFASPLSLGISGIEFKMLFITFNTKGKISLNHFASLANNLEARTAKELGMRMINYVQLMHDSHDYTVFWNKLAEPLKMDVGKRLAEQAKAEQEKRVAEAAKQNPKVNGNNVISIKRN